MGKPTSGKDLFFMFQEIEKELTRIRKKRNDLEENLKMLQEQKHQLFLCLKNSLLAKEYVRKEKTSNVYPEFHPNDESGKAFCEKSLFCWEMIVKIKSCWKIQSFQVFK